MDEQLMFEQALNSLDKTTSLSTEISKTTYIEDNEIQQESTTKFIANPNYEVGLAIDPDLLTEDQKNRLIKEFNTINNKNKITRTNISESSNQIDKTWKDFNEEQLAYDNNGAYEGTIGSIGSAAALASNIFNSVVGNASDFVNGLFDAGANIADDIVKALGSNGDKSSFGSFLKGSMQILSNNLKDYQDGVSETNFGSMMEQSWIGSSTRSFLNYFSKNKDAKKINILSSSPLDPGEQRESLFGTLMLGTPYLYNEGSDPTNRTLINTIIKDGRFLTLTPGMPKYNGTSYSQSKKDNILYQTETPDSMLRYLLSNGIDKNFSDKDKRYYTFKTNYAEYFKYLETMLNAIWIKLGLAKNGEEFNLFTFFDIKNQYDNGTVTTAELLSKYNSSIGYFVNGSGGINEAITNDRTGFGQELAGKANSASDEYQRLNYITGMGDGGSFKNAARKIGIAKMAGGQLKNEIGEHFGNTINAIKDVGSGKGIIGTLAKIAKIGISAVSDAATFGSTQDIGSLMQQFSTTNGMQLVYPELWASSGYSKSLNFNFSFVSPYGDPYSIFKYVYVPFCSLLCFALPRQASENGFVSPFFVRADLPGLFTSDLALIADMSWTRGGGQGLFTKDGLPRAMDVSITIDDLYPYLAMTKRISYLSANPSYSVFLDSFTGMLALNDADEDDDGLNRYFDELLNRVNGLESKNTIWNKFNRYKSNSITKTMQTNKFSISDKLDATAIPWLHNSSI